MIDGNYTYPKIYLFIDGNYIYPKIYLFIFNRPGVAGAVLQSPP